MATILYLGNNNVIELTGLTNAVTAAVDTGATATVTVRDTTGAVIAGDTWPKSMPHIAAGLYRATLNSAVAIVAGRQYMLEISVTGSGGEVAKWETPSTAQSRSA